MASSPRKSMGGAGGGRARASRPSGFRVEFNSRPSVSVYGDSPLGTPTARKSKGKMISGRLQDIISSQPTRISSANIMAAKASLLTSSQAPLVVLPPPPPTLPTKRKRTRLMSCWSNETIVQNLERIRVEVQLQYEGILKVMEWSKIAKEGSQIDVTKSYPASKTWILYFVTKDAETEIIDLVNILQNSPGSILAGETTEDQQPVPPLQIIQHDLNELIVACEDMGTKNNKFYRSVMRIKEKYDSVFSSKEKEQASSVPNATRGTLCGGHTVVGLHKEIRPGSRQPNAKSWELFGLKMSVLEAGFKELNVTFRGIQTGLRQATEVLKSIQGISFIPCAHTIRPSLAWYKKYHRKVVGRNLLPTEEERQTHDQIWQHIFYIIKQGLLIYKEISELVLTNRLGYMLIKGKAELDPKTSRTPYYTEVLERKYRRKFNDLIDWIDFEIPNDFYMCPYPDILRRLPVYIDSKNTLVGLYDHEQAQRKAEDKLKKKSQGVVLIDSKKSLK